MSDLQLSNKVQSRHRLSLLPVYTGTRMLSVHELELKASSGHMEPKPREIWTEKENTMDFFHNGKTMC